MADLEYRDVVEAETTQDLTDLSIRFAIQQLPERFTMLCSGPPGQESTERSVALKTWLTNHGHACTRLVAHWSRGSEKASQEWFLISPLTKKRMAKLEEAGLASTVAVGLGATEDILATIQAQAGTRWRFEGVEFPPNSFARALINQANRRSRRVDLVSALSSRATGSSQAS